MSPGRPGRQQWQLRSEPQARWSFPIRPTSAGQCKPTCSSRVARAHGPMRPAPAEASTRRVPVRPTTAGPLPSTTDPVAAAATSLPFTGANLGPIAFVGITAILVGALLLAESWFGWVRRLAHAGPVRRVDAMLSWFLGR
jgi:hypothetical protein